MSNLKRYHVRLQSPVSKSYRCTRAANSLDIDAEKKSVHELIIRADVETDFNIGVIVGASGSGKTTLAKNIFGDKCFNEFLELDKPVIDQFPKEFSYDECASILSGIGLTSVPCWIRPAGSLSNGQRARAEAALAMARSLSSGVVSIDEWTSVVDRTVAKVMSHCIQKHARKYKKKIVLCACHYDIVEWLMPDWVIDCNKEEYLERRSLRSERKEKLEFTIREVERASWKYYSKYHYLSQRLPGGALYLFGLFHGENQIGFQCFANYIPVRPGTRPIYHSNRVVVHPDYAGLGLGLRMVNACSLYMRKKFGFEIRATFSSTPMYKARLKDPVNWRLIDTRKEVGLPRASKSAVKESWSFNRLSDKKHSFRSNVTSYTFKFIGF